MYNIYYLKNNGFFNACYSKTHRKCIGNKYFYFIFKDSMTKLKRKKILSRNIILLLYKGFGIILYAYICINNTKKMRAALGNVQRKSTNARPESVSSLLNHI